MYLFKLNQYFPLWSSVFDHLVTLANFLSVFGLLVTAGNGTSATTSAVQKDVTTLGLNLVVLDLLSRSCCIIGLISLHYFCYNILVVQNLLHQVQRVYHFFLSLGAFSASALMIWYPTFYCSNTSESLTSSLISLKISSKYDLQALILIISSFFLWWVRSHSL